MHIEVWEERIRHGACKHYIIVMQYAVWFKLKVAESDPLNEAPSVP